MKTRLTYLSLITAILFVSFSGVQTAEAKIRVRASIRTPHIGIRVDTRPTAHHRTIVRRVSLPVRHYSHYDITKQDRKIARRLSQYTGVSKSELVSLRRQGYRWSEIGYWLDLPRATVRAAKDSDSWKRFLRHEQRHARGHRDRDWRYDEPVVCYHN